MVDVATCVPWRHGATSSSTSRSAPCSNACRRSPTAPPLRRRARCAPVAWSRPTTSSGSSTDSSTSRSWWQTGRPRRPASGCCRRSPTSPPSGSDSAATSEGVRRAHAEWVASLAASVAFGAPTDGPTIAAVQDEDAAIRDAVQWALEHDPLLALRICDSLSAFWFGTMRVSSGWELLAAALDASSGLDARRRTRARRSRGRPCSPRCCKTSTRPGGTPRRRSRSNASCGDPMRLGRATLMMALAAGYRNDGDWTRWIAESRTHFAAAGLRQRDWARRVRRGCRARCSRVTSRSQPNDCGPRSSSSASTATTSGRSSRSADSGELAWRDG